MALCASSSFVIHIHEGLFFFFFSSSSSSSSSSFFLLPQGFSSFVELKVPQEVRSEDPNLLSLSADIQLSEAKKISSDAA
ncbi:hypothetical protein KFK09_010908 [Dendrobium nobile]|uniref:Uncharacterized protein n=1 Tax=Dendrobium nobile TaxID=94219 RepID=A0A8T3BDD3_DENNO|nr:hypothetical protein KFK09_010908 [Dendrobium nobile]